MWDSEEIRTFFLHRLLTHNQALGLSVCCHSQWQAALAHRVTFELFVAELHWAMPWAARFDLALLWVNQVTCRGPLKPKILVAVDQIFLIIFFLHEYLVSLLFIISGALPWSTEGNTHLPVQFSALRSFMVFDPELWGLTDKYCGIVLLLFVAVKFFTLGLVFQVYFK